LLYREARLDLLSHALQRGLCPARISAVAHTSSTCASAPLVIIRVPSGPDTTHGQPFAHEVVRHLVQLFQAAMSMTQ
jgi:hypothetical protein